MPYCRYCLIDHRAEDMPSPRTCIKCREEQIKLGSIKVKKKRKARATRARNAVNYYFAKKRIQHKPYILDIPVIQDLLRQMIKVNGYKSRLVSVDHIIPITHSHVCGLTNRHNLLLVMHFENSAKGNKVDLDAESAYLLKWLQDRGL